MMFHKNTEKLESFIGCNSAFKGDVDSKGTLRVDGVVEGNISADWVIVGEKARITGNVTARGIVVGGKIDGNLKAKEIVEIKSKGQIKGEITSKKLVVAEGGIFDGKSMMPREESNVIELQTAETSR
ncbi:MAG: polymer-forming cytoskeletal protein [Nitrospiraceae bacterium]|jgi:cytoskeletal protein CcmA (bactofilin family)|nr:MAG: polymer-forming cytoskeletal protein [Nitrospiraceae bacterium]